MNLFRSIILSSSLFLYLSQSALARDSGPQGMFELRLKKFTNRHQTDINGNCCSDNSSADSRRTYGDSARCAGKCVTKYRVCLKHYMAQVDVNGECTFGEQTTDIIRSGDLTHLAPISFDIDFKWPGTFSLIIEALHTDTRSNTTLVHRVTKSRSLDASQDWTYGDDDRLEYDFRLVCAQNYFGRDCDVSCKPRDDNFGHYTCDEHGNKVCIEGWQGGKYCTTPVCAPGCSTQNGYCKKPGECKCHEGWQGPGCHDCKVYPGCEHGTCSSPYECQCKTGWGGWLCNKDLNFCTNHRPCQNGATCFNTGDDYTCSCPIGFSGRNCEIRVVNKCLESPCKNGGECMSGGEEDYECKCQSGFYGHHCEFQSDFDICSTNPCENSATCVPSITSGYQCHCPPGFEGRNCEINTDDCAGEPCTNGGTCFDFINSYKCICPNGYIGEHCQENYNDCKNEPCANGGTCTDGVNDFTCACTPGFTGKDCSLEINECDEDPCLNGGFCIDGNNTFTCRCLPRHSGKYCEILPDGSIDPKYYKLKGVPYTSSNSANHILIGTFSTLVPLIAVVALCAIFCMKQRRKMEQQRADYEAQLENELNAVNSMNKTKMLEDHMIVNSLDFPRQKSINTDPNITDEMKFAAKEESYNQMSRAKSTKQLNTDMPPPSSLMMSQQQQRSANLYCDSANNRLVETASSASYSVRSTPTKHAAAAERSRLIMTKNTNLDLSSSTLCSSSSEKSGYKKDLTAQYLGGGLAPSPAPSSTYTDDPQHPATIKCTVEDDLLATEV